MSVRESIGKSQEKVTTVHRRWHARSVSELGKDEKEVFEMMEAFGFGMGTMGTCGAVSAMAAVVGMIESDGNLDSAEHQRKPELQGNERTDGKIQGKRTDLLSAER